MKSDPLDQKFNINYEKIHSYYHKAFETFEHCNIETGCNVNMTSPAERKALETFYADFKGNNWRFNYNWLEGDPCLNHWYGVYCNNIAQVISLHFFENHLVGGVSANFADLIHLRSLIIINGDISFEGAENVNRN